MPTALVTGATGLVGMHLVPRLQREGWRVRALVRDAARAGLLSRADVTLATGDVLEPTGFERAARGCDVVFHAAAVITPRGGWEAFRRPNIEGTRNAIAAATTAKARLVHVSSVAVYGDNDRYARRRPEDRRERSDRPDPRDVVLRAIEARVGGAGVRGAADRRALGDGGATHVIYGPFDRQFVPRLARTLRHGFAPVIGGGHNTLADRARGERRRRHGARGDARRGGWTGLQPRERLRRHGRASSSSARRGNGRRVCASSRFRMVVARAAFGAFETLAPMIVGDRFNVATKASLDFLARDNPFSSELRAARAGMGSAGPTGGGCPRRSAGGRAPLAHAASAWTQAKRGDTP